MDLEFSATTTFCEGFGDTAEDVEVTPGEPVGIDDESTSLRNLLVLSIQAHNHKNRRVKLFRCWRRLNRWLDSILVGVLESFSLKKQRRRSLTGELRTLESARELVGDLSTSGNVCFSVGGRASGHTTGRRQRPLDYAHRSLYRTPLKDLANDIPFVYLNLVLDFVRL